MSRSVFSHRRPADPAQKSWGKLSILLETSAKAGTLLSTVRPDDYVGHQRETSLVLQQLKDQFEAVILSDVGAEAKRQAADRISQIRRWSLLLAQVELTNRNITQSNFRQ